MTNKKVICPSCEKEFLEHLQTTLDVPHFGETLILTSKCKSCNYKKTDVLSISGKTPQRYVFHVESPNHLKVRMVKSGNATVLIPEFQFESIPGPRAQGFIGSIESILEQVETTIQILKKWTKKDPNKRKRIEELELLLEDARGENPSFTVVLEDPSGNSAILPDPPDKVEISPL